ncbi:DHHA1 domain-containing protein [Marinobacterium aestuariivivens]|uniref:DHHA1 domain-containing protein n=1 Tax=Marinobacterium aestuariivivens TaxID=1698799 RepID=A0ABW1ZXH6_9GAMM
MRRTGDIGLLKVVAESGIASGVRRIEAVTGAGAEAYLGQLENTCSEIASLTRGSRDNLVDKVRGLSDRNRQLEKELEQLKGKLASLQGGELVGRAVEVKGVKVLVEKLDGVEPKALRDTLDQLKNKLGSGVVVLAVAQDDKVSLVAGVTKDLTGRVKAGDLIRELSARVGGKGGGRPDMAQGGGADVAALPAALAAVPGLLEAAL